MKKLKKYNMREKIRRKQERKRGNFARYTTIDPLTHTPTVLLRTTSSTESLTRLTGTTLRNPQYYAGEKPTDGEEDRHRAKKKKSTEKGAGAAERFISTELPPAKIKKTKIAPIEEDTAEQPRKRKKV